MDPLSPPTSVKSLLRRFRYTGLPPGTLPNGPLSMQSVLARLEDEQARKKFLHYNCWLLAPKLEFQYIVETVYGGSARFIVCADIAGAQLLTKVLEHYTTDDICNSIFPEIVDVCGISVDPLNQICKLTHSLLELADWLLEDLGFAIGEIFHLIGAGEDLIIKAIEFLYFGVSGFPIPGQGKPDIPDRAFEIGREAASYDIVSLVEVWDDSSKKSVLAFGNSNPNLDGRYFTGPGVPLAGS